MSFGATGQEKQNTSQVQGIATELQNLLGAQEFRGGKTFKQFETALKPVLQRDVGLLSGDRNLMGQLLGPEITAVSSQYDAARRSAAELSPRGGARASDINSMGAQEAQQVGNLYENARNYAAQDLEQLGGLFSGTSSSQLGLGLGAAGQASQSLLGVNQQLIQQQQLQNSFIGDLIGGALGAGGAVGGGLLEGKAIANK